MWIKLDSGQRVSLLDLWGYVNDNPELAALAKRNVDVVDDSQPGASSRWNPWAVKDNYEAFMSHPDVQKNLPWVGGAWAGCCCRCWWC